MLPGRKRPTLQHWLTRLPGSRWRRARVRRQDRRSHTEEQAREEAGHQQRRDDADRAATSRSWRKAARVRRYATGMRVRRWLHVALIARLLATNLTSATTELTIIPSSPSAAASRIGATDLNRLGADLERAGLTLPPRIVVTLIEEADPRARGVPEWVVGLALEPDEIVVFPGRILSYPYDSIESVFRHEVAHLALSARAGGQPMPRWFHEGLAVSVDAGWGVTGRLRLLLEMTGNPAPPISRGSSPRTRRQRPHWPTACRPRSSPTCNGAMVEAHRARSPHAWRTAFHSPAPFNSKPT